MRLVLFWAAAGLALPAAFLALLAAGAPSPWAAAACAVFALLPQAFGLPRASAPALLAAAAGSLLTAVVILPAAGIWGAAGLAAATALYAWRRPLQSAGGPAGGTGSLAAGVVAAIGLWRCLAYLLGHSLYAATAVAVALAAGLAAGRLARPACRGLRDALPGSDALLMALIGGCLLQLLRVVGLNAAEAERIQAPILSGSDGFFLCAQAGILLAAFAAALGALEDEASDSRSGRLALAAAPAAVLMWAALGPPGATALSFVALAAFGAWKGRARWMAHAIWSRLVPLILVLVVALAWSSRRLLADITFNRLVAVYPGGELLSAAESRGQNLAVYRFSTGLKVLLRDGVADFAGGDQAKLAAHLCFLSHPSKTALFAGALHPEMLPAALSHGVAVKIYDSHPRCAEAFGLMGAAQDAPISCGRIPAGAFDLIFVEAAAPFWAPEQALAATSQSARRWRRRLNAGGLLAWRLPVRLDTQAAAKAAAALAREFPAVTGVTLGSGCLLLAGEKADIESHKAGWSPNAAALADLPEMNAVLQTGLSWNDAIGINGPAASAWRPLAALPARINR